MPFYYQYLSRPRFSIDDHFLDLVPENKLQIGHIFMVFNSILSLTDFMRATRLQSIIVILSENTSVDSYVYDFCLIGVL